MKNKTLLTTAQTAALMAIFTIVSKFLGFMREMVLAGCYGVGTIADSYVMAQSIPSTILAGLVSAVAVSYMPVFSQRCEIEGKESGDLFTSKVLNLLLSLVGAITFLGIVFAGPLVKVFAPGYGAEAHDLTAYYLRIAFFTVVFTVLIYIFSAYLHYRGIFVSQIIYGFTQNFLIIFGILLSAKIGYRFLIIGVVAGYGVNAILHVVKAKKEGFVYTPSFDFKGAVNEVVGLAVPVFIGGYVTQINTAIDKMLASGLQEGSVSALNYGFLIVNFIATFTTNIFVTILYPKLNQAFVKGDYERMSNIAERGINLIALLAVPFTFGTMRFSSEVIGVIYEHGAFNEAATELTSQALFWYSIGLSFIAVNAIITKIFYSMHDSKTAVYCSGAAVVLNIALNFALVGPMKHAGLALATSIAQAVNAVLLYVSCKKKYPKIRLLSSGAKLGRICAFSAISVFAAHLCFALISDIMQSCELAALAAAVLVAVGSYLLLLKRAGFEELDLLGDLLKRKKNAQ